jgi:hypothetical protein
MDRLKVGWEVIDGKTLDSRVIEISKHQIMDFYLGTVVGSGRYTSYDLIARLSVLLSPQAILGMREGSERAASNGDCILDLT